MGHLLHGSTQWSAAAAKLVKQVCVCLCVCVHASPSLAHLALTHHTHPPPTRLAPANPPYEQKELSLGPPPTHFPETARELQRLEKGFADMVFDVPDPEGAVFQSVEAELVLQEAAEAVEKRQSAFNVARMQSVGWLARLQYSFQQFKREAVDNARTQKRAVHAELDYDLTLKVRACVLCVRACICMCVSFFFFCVCVSLSLFLSFSLFTLTPSPLPHANRRPW